MIRLPKENVQIDQIHFLNKNVQNDQIHEKDRDAQIHKKPILNVFLRSKIKLIENVQNHTNLKAKLSEYLRDLLARFNVSGCEKCDFREA